MNLYWNKTGADAHWDTLTGNWWTNTGYSIQASALPITGDFVYLRGATAPDSAPATAVALSGFDTQGLTAAALNSAVTSGKVSIQAGGTLTIGDPAAPGDQHDWGGTTAATGTFTFNDFGTSALGATVGDHAVFNALTTNFGTIGDYGTFGEDCYNEGVAGDHTTFNIAVNNNVTGDYAIFNDGSDSSGVVGDYATFNDVCYNDGGTVGDYATFNDDSFSTGAVGNYARFVNLTANRATIGTGAIFDISTNQTLSGQSAHLNDATIIGHANLTIDGAGATAITNTGAIIRSDNGTVTVTNLNYATATAPIRCYRCTAGTGNGAAVLFDRHIPTPVLDGGMGSVRAGCGAW